jgi:hypothetical protein
MSTKYAASSLMRLDVHDGQRPLFLHEKGPRHLVAAPGANNASESSRQVAAAEVAAQLLLYVEGIAFAVVAALDAVGEQRQQMLPRHSVQRALVRLPRPVARRQSVRRRALETFVDP